MNRLRAELLRLYAAHDAVPRPTAAAQPGRQSSGLTDGIDLIGGGGEVRALVVEGVCPVGWSALGKLWQGVQTELELPPPAIAVSGVDGLQLWFSLVRPVLASRGQAFLAALVGRFLPDVAPRRLRLWPALEAGMAQPGRHAPWVPAEQGDSGNWSAFVAHDLAPVFADAPWLDLPPGEEGQVNLLRNLRSITPAAFDAAWQQLTPAPAKANQQPLPPERPNPPPAEEPSMAAFPAAGVALPSSASAPAAGQASESTADDDPVRFLRQVMNDASAPLALRIEAAKALLLTR